MFLEFGPDFSFSKSMENDVNYYQKISKIENLSKENLKNSFLLKKIFVIYHLTPEKEQNADEKFRKFMRKLLFFEGKCKIIIDFWKKICQKNF